MHNTYRFLKTLTLCFLLVGAAMATHAGSASGHWVGKIEAPGGSIDITVDLPEPSPRLIPARLARAWPGKRILLAWGTNRIRAGGFYAHWRTSRLVCPPADNLPSGGGLARLVSRKFRINLGEGSGTNSSDARCFIGGF